MDKTRRKDILVRIGWAALMGLIACLLVLSVQRKMHADVTSMKVVIKPLTGKQNLINEKEVEKVFNSFLGFNVKKANIQDLSLSELEALLKSDKRIKRVEIFIDSDNKLNVWIVQKQPIVRIVDGDNYSYYLDEDGEQLEVRKGHAIRVPIATGYIDLYDKKVMESDKRTKLKEVFEVAKMIQKDQFLSALVDQIDVDSKREIVLIPKLGRDKIVLGDASNLEEKVYNLKMWYTVGPPKEGWGKYAVLNLKYRGQVVGEKL